MNNKEINEKIDILGQEISELEEEVSEKELEISELRSTIVSRTCVRKQIDSSIADCDLKVGNKIKKLGCPLYVVEELTMEPRDIKVTLRFHDQKTYGYYMTYHYYDEMIIEEIISND